MRSLPEIGTRVRDAHDLRVGEVVEVSFPRVDVPPRGAVRHRPESVVVLFSRGDTRRYSRPGELMECSGDAGPLPLITARALATDS